MSARLIWVGGTDAASMTDRVRRIVPDADFTITAFPVENWNRDLSPWAAPAVFDEPFAGAAGETLRRLREMAGEDAYLAGYSLAGLFVLWAVHTGGFAGAASCSGSVWYPGWMDWAAAHPLGEERIIYLSLGMKEERTRHPVMRQVGDATRAYHATLTHLRARQLTWHPGGHFTDPEGRVAQGLAWLAMNAKEA